jgi:hypothetical protein
VQPGVDPGPVGLRGEPGAVPESKELPFFLVHQFGDLVQPELAPSHGSQQLAVRLGDGQGDRPVVSSSTPWTPSRSACMANFVS